MTAIAPLSPVDFWTGIVCDVFGVPRVPGDPSVFVSVSRVADYSALGLSQSATNAGSGAGLTERSAHAAAIGESVERYAVAVPTPEALIFSSAEQLRARGQRHIAPSEWALFDPEDIADHATLVPFADDTRLAWMQGDSLTAREHQWVPACLVQMPYVPQVSPDHDALIDFATSTGLACGRTRREALMGGIREIIERDAFVIMWRNMLAAPRLDLHDDSETGRLFAKVFARPGLDYNLFYTTLDLEMPSFFGYVVDHRRDPPAVVAGGAAHPTPAVAAVKTLLELAQGLAWVHNPGRNIEPVIDDFDSVRSFDDHMRLYADNPPMDAFGFLESSPAVSLSEIKPLPGTDPLASITDVFRKRDMDLVAVDVTTADVAECGLSVVKVLAPQCELLDASHALQHLGGKRWRDHRREGADVNDYPHPYP